MKAISLTQPWASLVAWGEKQIETRSWATNYRGPIAIHASKGFPAWAKNLCWDQPFRLVLSRHFREAGLGVVWSNPPLPLGAVIATAELEWCVKIDPGFEFPAGPEHEHEFGDYPPGRYAWGFSNVKALGAPRPARGALGLWEWRP